MWHGEKNAFQGIIFFEGPEAQTRDYPCMFTVVFLLASEKLLFDNEHVKCYLIVKRKMHENAVGVVFSSSRSDPKRDNTCIFTWLSLFFIKSPKVFEANFQQDGLQYLCHREPKHVSMP